MRVPFLTLRSVAAIAGVLTLAACEAANEPDGLVPTPGSPASVIPLTPGNGAANLEEFELCKYGSSATFSYSVFDKTTSNTTNGTISLNDGDCRVIALFGGLGADVTVNETSAQSGFMLDRVDVTTITTAGTQGYTQSTSSVTEEVSGSGGTLGLRGALAQYYNKGIPFGGEGCTPGYWKQPHHFDSWPAPYQPTDLFSAYFEDAFPGKTLLQVLSTGGGKLIALGRHTVAALLNSASSGVDYNLTTAEVIAEFNATYPASNYGPQKDRFASFNEQGCPLN
ncbi:MAG: hypothetical protein OEV95_09855 [Gemmatimonadota bacterium]|nr:hypothetical protein [Gemmatimonadota bacterium]